MYVYIVWHHHCERYLVCWAWRRFYLQLIRAPHCRFPMLPPPRTHTRGATGLRGGITTALPYGARAAAQRSATYLSRRDLQQCYDDIGKWHSIATLTSLPPTYLADSPLRDTAPHSILTVGAPFKQPSYASTGSMPSVARAASRRMPPGDVWWRTCCGDKDVGGVNVIGNRWRKIVAISAAASLYAFLHCLPQLFCLYLLCSVASSSHTSAASNTPQSYTSCKIEKKDRRKEEEEEEPTYHFTARALPTSPSARSPHAWRPTYHTPFCTAPSCLAWARRGRRDGADGDGRLGQATFANGIQQAAKRFGRHHACHTRFTFCCSLHTLRTRRALLRAPAHCAAASTSFARDGMANARHRRRRLRLPAF